MLNVFCFSDVWIFELYSLLCLSVVFIKISFFFCKCIHQDQPFQLWNIIHSMTCIDMENKRWRCVLKVNKEAALEHQKSFGERIHQSRFNVFSSYADVMARFMGIFMRNERYLFCLCLIRKERNGNSTPTGICIFYLFLKKLYLGH